MDVQNKKCADPILEKLGNPVVEITNDYIKAGDLKIPRSEDGSIIIKYPKKKTSRTCSRMPDNGIW